MLSIHAASRDADAHLATILACSVVIDAASHAAGPLGSYASRGKNAHFATLRGHLRG